MTTSFKCGRSRFVSSPAIAAGLVCLVVGASACSGIDDREYGDELGEGSEVDTVGGSEEGGPEESEDEGSTGEGESSGEEEGSDETTGVEDPSLNLELCDSSAGQTIDLDLGAANDEVVASLVREAVLSGSGDVPEIPLSSRPFLNEFEFGYGPSPEDTPTISGELWKPSVANSATQIYRLQFAVQVPEMHPEQRPPVDLAIVVDLGPSMIGEPLALADEALAALEDALRPGDRVSLIAAGESPVVLLEAEAVFNPNELDLDGGLMESLSPGYADVAGALELAYEIGEQTWDEDDGQHRVVLVSNGNFSHSDALVDLVEDHAEHGHLLVGVGLGDPQSFSEPALRALGRAGRGLSFYSRDAEELWERLDEDFTSSLIAVGQEAEVRLHLPPGLGISSRDPGWGEGVGEPGVATLTPSRALVFHHELELCGELDEQAVISVELEWTEPALDEGLELGWELPVSELGFGSAATRKGAATIAYVQALRVYRGVVGQPTQGYGSVLSAISLISEALEAAPEDEDLIEMSEVLAKLGG
ncbi:hypothetical protein G6O69_11480 [Pseudenhygromyxa sp. WMMC2535]|uniref:hypothetical protein n=1 Tax=Pseudenhygromyxa sp. WMMC2535 TaxID=2712867 RepID=UPI001554C672|nr:hypothetical protein [Pseudenhygromyxa sp. WMMC2535]NVB38454.1 hypothetical protein [Pseudenhygromyxa sp. WMMC2535]